MDSIDKISQTTFNASGASSTTILSKEVMNLNKIRLRRNFNTSGKFSPDVDRSFDMVKNHISDFIRRTNVMFERMLLPFASEAPLQLMLCDDLSDEQIQRITNTQIVQSRLKSNKPLLTIHDTQLEAAMESAKYMSERSM